MKGVLRALPEQRPLITTVLLVAIYSLFSAFVDDGGMLAVDSGSKVATLEIMARHGTLDPDIGYWAEQWDPAGNMHPLFQTAHVNDSWVSVTTLPMLLVAVPLYALGGLDMALLLPMLGTVLAAFGARRLAQDLSGDPAVAFWVVALGSPLAVYALEFWEHSFGTALMIWGVVFALRCLGTDGSPGVASRDQIRRIFVAGLFFGLAATMRTEAIIYGLVTIVAMGLVFAFRRRWRHAIGIAVGGVAGIGIVNVLNVLLEVAVLGESFRFGRSARAIEMAPEDGLAKRVHEAAWGTFDPTAAGEASTILLGAVITGLLAIVAISARKSSRSMYAPVAAALVCLLYLVRVGRAGLSFATGMFPATPMAAAGMVALRGATFKQRLTLLIAIAPLPLVWMTQWLDGVGFQWGSRYMLLTGALLVVVGTAVLQRVKAWTVWFFVGTSITVTAFGAVWLQERSTMIVSIRDHILSVPADGYISREAFLFREFGATYTTDRRWLSVSRDDDVPRAFDVFGSVNARTVAVVQEVDDQNLDVAGWRVVGSSVQKDRKGFAVITYERGL